MDSTFAGLQEALISSDNNEIQASLDAMITFSENTHFDEALLAQGTLSVSETLPTIRFPTSHVHNLLLPVTMRDQKSILPKNRFSPKTAFSVTKRNFVTSGFLCFVLFFWVFGWLAFGSQDPLTKVCGSILKFAAELFFSGVTKTGTILSFNFKFCSV